MCNISGETIYFFMTMRTTREQQKYLKTIFKWQCDKQYMDKQWFHPRAMTQLKTSSSLLVFWRLKIRFHSEHQIETTWQWRLRRYVVNNDLTPAQRTKLQTLRRQNKKSSSKAVFVDSVINTSKSDKACNSDGIGSKLHKVICEVLKFNCHLFSVKYMNWTFTNMIGLSNLKKKGSVQNVQNYRDISLLNISSKNVHWNQFWTTH